MRSGCISGSAARRRSGRRRSIIAVEWIGTAEDTPLLNRYLLTDGGGRFRQRRGGHGGLGGRERFVRSAIVCTIPAIAAPPVSGGTLIIFGDLFQQMGCPMEAMIFAAACDVFYDCPDVAINNAPGILENAYQEDRHGMVDKAVLRDPGNA